MANNGRRYTAKFKARVISAVIGAGESPGAVAKRHKVALQTVQRWVKDAPPELQRSVESVENVDLSVLGPELIREMFKALVVHAKLAQDETWLREHGPGEVATLSGVLADKLFRILDSASTADQGTDPDGE